MVTLEKITTKELKHILDIAEKENIFVKGTDDANMSITDIVLHFGKGKDFHPFKVVEGDKTIGFITSFPYKEKDTLSLGVMYTLKEYRGKGYGREMIALFLDYAKFLGYKKVFTKTWSKNIPSNTLFKSLGFIETRRKLKDRIDGDDTVEYLKFLS